MSKTNIPQARLILAGVVKDMGTTDLHARRIEDALALMTRKPVKKAARRKIIVNQQNKEACRLFLATPEAATMTDTEIAKHIFGHECAAGRVSEIRNGVAYEPWAA